MIKGTSQGSKTTKIDSVQVTSICKARLRVYESLSPGTQKSVHCLCVLTSVHIKWVNFIQNIEAFRQDK